MSDICFDNITFQQVQIGLEAVRLDTNVKKDLPIPNNEVVKAVAGNQATGLGALLVPTEEYGSRDFKVFWQQMPHTTPMDAGSYGQDGGLTCDVPTGTVLKEKSTSFEIPIERASQPILINESRYRSKPFMLENDLIKQIGERIISLENEANQYALDFLYKNRGINEHPNPDYVKVSGNDTYFGNGKIGDPNNMGYLLDFVDMNDLGQVRMIDGGALHLPIWEASKNASDDDKRSQEAKFMELTQGRFNGYTRDLRGTARYLRALKDEKHPNGINKGFFILEDGVVSMLSKHYYPALVNQSVLNSRQALFNSLGINDFAQRFGENGQYHNTGTHKVNYSIPSFNLSQQFIDPQTGVVQTVPVYIDVEHDIDCVRKQGRGPRLRNHKIQLFLRYGFFKAPTDLRPNNTGIYLFSESCDFTPQGWCAKNPCDEIASLGVKLDSNAGVIELEANPIYEMAMPGTDEKVSGRSIANQMISVYREVSGSKYGQLVASFDNAQLQTANTIHGLKPNSKYWIKAEAWFSMGQENEDCYKSSEACIQTKGADSLCGAIDVDFDTSVAGKIGASISMSGQNLNLNASLTEYMLSVKDSNGTMHALGTGSSIGDFPLSLPNTVASGEATIKGYMQVGDCKVDIDESIMVTSSDAPVATANTFDDLTVGQVASLDVLANDQFACAPAAVELRVVDAPSKGSIAMTGNYATINANGGIDYTPSQEGDDVFSYQIRCQGATTWSNTVQVTTKNTAA